MNMAKQEKKSGEPQRSCKQCGICCVKGGAALHGADIELLGIDGIPRRDLITLRKGEFAWNPVNNKVEAIKTEIIKLRGTGKKWVCLYLDDASKGCGIYERRPIACRTLKCWEPKESLALIGIDLLSRMDVLQKEIILLELAERYERDNPLPDFSSLLSKLKKNPEQLLQELELSVNKDLAFRDEQLRNVATVSSDELFLFGRPLFQLLVPFGIEAFQVGNRLCLRKSAQ
jgi:Fe-S-cluster containining protein